MLVGIHQLHYLPWLRYFEKMARPDVFIVLDNIQFNKNGWQNRNRIKGPAGPILLTVPVHNRQGQRLDEVRINNNAPWRKKHWKTIQQCYSKAPYFLNHAPFLADTYEREWDSLNALNRHMLGYFAEAFGITTRVVYASELDAPGAATERLVNLIRAVGGDTYYSGAFALEVYLDAELLAENGIGLQLQHWRPPSYPQLYGEFEPDLSALDLLMNCGDGSLDIILSGAEKGPNDTAQ